MFDCVLKRALLILCGLNFNFNFLRLPYHMPSISVMKAHYIVELLLDLSILLKLLYYENKLKLDWT